MSFRRGIVVFALGCFALVAQTVLFREFLTAFEGNELGVGCFFGFHTTGGAEGGGRSTTQAVVVSTMIILVLDAFWAAPLL